MDNARGKQPVLSFGLFILVFSLYTIPLIPVHLLLPTSNAQGFANQLLIEAVWWLYFFPAVYVSYRYRYRGALLITMVSLCFGIYLAYMSLADQENVIAWWHGLLALIASTAVALFVGSLSEQFNRSREAIEEQHARLKSLFRSSQVLASSLKLEEVLDRCLVLIRATFGFDYADIWLVEGNSTLRRAASNIPDSFNVPDTFPADFCLPGLALSSGNVVFIDDPLRDGRIVDKTWARQLGHRAEVAVPIIHKEEKLGVLIMASMSECSFTPEIEELLHTFGNQFALSLKNARLYREMEEKAIIDELTGLYNYRFFQEALERECRRAEREGLMFGLLLMDIDYFKDYNDTFGHPEGDRLLAEFGNVLRGTVRETDIAVRYGGDEFAVILPHTDELGTKQLAQRIAAVMSAHPFAGADSMPGGKISISLGHATYPIQGKDKVTLVKVADDSLYKVKEKRRRERKHLRSS